jgi:putative membrane-bound dehydrogenase-like protein
MKPIKFATLAVLACGLPVHAQVPINPRFGFPVYTNQPAGKQLSGQHAPATTPALSPADAQKKFTVPTGFQVRLFASEPEVVNPVAMSWDDRGRLWVLELYEYPMGVAQGQKGRDRIKILEDTDNDGRADKVTVFADGMSLATGLLVGNGGVFVGQAPNLYWMEDTNGDDIADKKTVVLTGFGLEDRHELLNGFTWGPDGQLYMTHGVFTHTKAIDPSQPADPVVVTAGVARLNPQTRRFEVFAEGTSNPWGVDFDTEGNAFVSACVIDHLFHLAPGGIYVRQAGQPPNPYAYDLLPSIVDHKHHMAAYAGVQVYHGNQFPADYYGTILMGNIHDNAIHQDRLARKGSSFVASFGQDFVRANDGWFMPVSTQVGPDGAVWIMDWYDRYPCYQNANADPAGVDRERGRIWRVVHVGDNPTRAVPPRPSADMNLGRLSNSELVALLAHPNSWQRRTAQRLLQGRPSADTKPALIELMGSGATPEARLAALWTLFSSGLITDPILDIAANASDRGLRVWAARFTGERHETSEATKSRLEKLATDADPAVRSAVATAIRQFHSSTLTIDTPPHANSQKANLGNTLARLIESSKDASDPVIPFMIWQAAEPLTIPGVDYALGYLADSGQKNMPLSGHLAARVFRRICDARDPNLLDKTVRFFMELPAEFDPFAAAAIQGMLEGLRGKAIAPSVPTEPLIKKLLASSNRDLAARAQRLGALWGDASALRALLSRIQDGTISESERITAIRSARQSKTEDTRNALYQVVTSVAPDTVKIEAIRALSEVNADDTGDRLLVEWDKSSPAIRQALAELMTTRSRWTGAFLAAVQKGSIKRGDIPPNVVRNLGTHKNDYVRNEAIRTFGRFNSTPAEKLSLIRAKRQIVINGPVDLEQGRLIAAKSCFICHKLHGEGADIGPDLTGVGRSSLDALLHNVISPNEIIGQGYENVEVETRDGRTLSGRMVENTDVRVKLLLPGPIEEVVGKSDVKSVRVTENSAMPEGLENMPDQDFRNLIWYILAPPQDGKPLTPKRRQELIQAGGDQASAETAKPDGESVALWNPEWRVLCPPFEGAPAKFPEFAGRRNVLMTHPFDRERGATLERTLTLPAGANAVLSVWVAAHEQGDWDLRVRVGDRLLHRQSIDHNGPRWKQVQVDLSSLAGSTSTIRLENFATDWSWEFAYWADLQIRNLTVAKPTSN